MKKFGVLSSGRRLAAAMIVMTSLMTVVVGRPSISQAATCPAGTTAHAVTWGASSGIVWNDAIQDSGATKSWPLGSTGVTMSMTIDDPFSRNEDANNPLLNVPSTDGNWDTPVFTKTDGVYGAGYLTWAINSTDDDEDVTFTLDYDRPVLVPDFSIGDVDFLGVDYDVSVDHSGDGFVSNANPHDSFQDEVLLSAERSGTPVGFSGTTGTAGRPVITVNDAVNGQFAVAGGPYGTGAAGGGNLAPGDAAGTVTLATLAPVTSVVFSYSNGPADKAAEVAKIGTLPGAQWNAANWAAPLTGYETGVSNNHAIRVNNFTVCVGILVVGDAVWADVDGDGVADVGEPGLAGVTVTLFGADGIELDSTTTDANGAYSFGELPPWDYTVEVTPPSGYVPGYDLDGGDDASISVTLAGTSELNAGFGLVPPAGVVDGTVFHDRGHDGAFDGVDGDTAIEGVTVTLAGTDLGGEPLSSVAVTDTNGYYVFNDVPAGTYTLTETQPAGFDDGADAAGTNASLGSNDTFAVTLDLGESSVGNDFAELSSASIGGTVVEDLDNDGVADGGETGISGVVMTLSGTDEAGNVVSLTQTTDGSGVYAFSDLRPGTYTVSEGAAPGYLDGDQNVGSEGGTEADDELASIVLGVNVTGVDYDFGELAAASITGSVVDDQGNPIEGVSVTLTGTDDLGAPVSLVATTDASGNYLFDALRPGTYDLAETQPVGYGDGPDSSPTGTVGNDAIDNITITPGQASGGHDFTETTSSLSGTVVDDAGDGILDVAVTLQGLDADGNAIDRTVLTDTNGDYTFEGLLSGDYEVTEAQPLGYGDGSETDGSLNNGTVTDDRIASIELPAGSDVIDYDFAERRSSLSGAVVVDDNSDGIADPGEQGIVGVTITLTGTDADGQTVERSTVTDSDGRYQFAGLLAGDYTVTEGATPGYIDGAQNAGTSGGLEADDVISSIALGAGIDATGYDFGETIGSSIAGTVVDDDGNGIAGVTITLSGQDVYGTSVDRTVVTDGAGDYVFGSLAPGTYTVTETQPLGYGDGGEASADGVVSNDRIADIDLVSGDDSVGNDFDETRGSIAGTVYIDANNDGVQQVGEAAIPGVTLTLTGLDDRGAAVSRSTVTDVNGVYLFDDLISGDYTVAETQDVRFLDGIDAAGSEGGDDTANDVVSAIRLPAGVDAVDYDFGELVAASISGVVFDDGDNDGTQDTADLGIGGVTLTLSGTNDLGASISLTTTTDVDGSYSFDGLRPGNYAVVESQPPSHLDGIDTLGSVGGDGSINDEFSDILLTSGERAASYDFAELGGSSIAGSVVELVGGAGIPDTTVNLTGIDDLGTTVTLSTSTDINGAYRFDNLRPGVYSVEEEQPAGFGDGGETDGSLVNGVVTNDRIASIELPASTDATDYDFDELRSSLGGTVFHDLDDDGSQDAAEVGIPNVQLRLTGTDDRGDAVDLVTTTDSDGDYLFSALISGSYDVVETQPVPYNDGIDTAGSSGGDDSTTNDSISAIGLGAGVDAANYDFAETGTVLSGVVWLDTDGDGNVDGAESGRLGGIIVTLLNADGDVVATVTTGADGTFAFGDLVAGDYTITQSQPGAYGTTTPNSMDVSVPVGGLPSVDFGELGSRIDGRVWDDDIAAPAAGDGVDNGEPGYAGVVVELRSTTGVVVATTTTDATGAYSFADLPAGDYLIAVLPPEGQTVSPKDNGSADDVDSDADLVTKLISVTMTPGQGIGNLDTGLQEEDIDLAVDLVADKSSVSVGSNVTYTVTGSNVGNAAVLGTVMTTTLPSGASFVSAVGAGWECSAAAQLVTCTYADPLLPGQAAPAVAIVAKVTGSGTLSASASIRPATAGLSEATTSNNADQVPITVSASSGLRSSLPSALAFTGASTLLLVVIGGFFLGSGTLATVTVRRKR